MRRTLLGVLIAAIAVHFGNLRAEALLVANRVATGLQRPVFVTSAPGDANRLFILEQHSGKILLLDRSAGAIATFLTVSDISTGEEQGLLGLAFHPAYATNRYFYVNLTAADGATHVRRYETSAGDPNMADAGSATTTLTIPQPQANHNGGWIGFGPDGYLYIATGDGGGDHDSGAGHMPATGNAQDVTDNLLGKILRIDVDGDAFPLDSNHNYAIPPTNPFVGVDGDDEIWVYGLRQPWRASFDRLNGALYIADRGEATREEIDVHPAASSPGTNYGWRLREGTIATPTGGVGGSSPAGAVDPIYDYAHGVGTTQGSSIVGGYVYRGPNAGIAGQYFFADAVNHRIWSLRYDGADPDTFDGTNFTDFADWTNQIVPDAGSIDTVVSFGEDASGSMFIIDPDGEIFEIGATIEPTGVDHFTLYTSEVSGGTTPFYRFGPVALTDQYHSAAYNIVGSARLGVPADKNSEGILDATTHLQEYGIAPVITRPRFIPRRNIRAFNQCNSFYVQVVAPRSVLVPTNLSASSQPPAPSESEHALDHFLCYKASLERRYPNRRRQRFPKKQQVDVADGFQTRRYNLLGITKFCTPVAKAVDPSRPPALQNGPSEGQPFAITPSSIRNPETNLLCYKAKLARTYFAQTGCGVADPRDDGTPIVPRQLPHSPRSGLYVNNQFGPLRLDSVSHAEICIPTVVVRPPTQAVPGSFAATIKGKLPGGPHFTRLAMYSFQSGGTMRQDFWYWRSNEPNSSLVYGPSDRQVGFSTDDNYTLNNDQNEFIQGMRSFLADESGITTMYGTWQVDGNNLHIDWSSGDSEDWQVTWKDNNSTLYKIELQATNYTTGLTYLEARRTRSNTIPINAGWGFGGPGWGFTYARPFSEAVPKNYYGKFIRHNSWCWVYGGPEVGDQPVLSDQLNPPSMFPTSTGALRSVYRDDIYWVFAYFANPQSNPGMLARRVMYEISHDWANDGNIADDIGHTYSGLQIIDAAGALRGFVFADSSIATDDACGEDQTISSLFYLDDRSCDAQDGFDPDVTDEPCL